MKKNLCAICMLTIFSCSSTFASTLDQRQIANEERQVSFAERVIVVELTRALSDSVRKQKEKCFSVCMESGALELGIGLIGVGRGESSAAALVNLLGVRLDGGGAEERTCQILNRGRKLSNLLSSISAKETVNHCRAIFVDLKKRELRDVLDVKIDQVCQAESEVILARDEISKAINSSAFCE